MNRTFAAALVVLAGALAPSAFGYDISNRWTSTKTDGGGLTWGDPTTLLWSVVPDGESWSRGGPSDVIDTLDDGWGVAAVDRTPDLTNRPWWSIMDRVYDQYTRVSGLTMVYTPEQHPDGSDTGQSGDIRIGGVPFTWENDTGGVLADNSFPNNGDMRIDTYRNPSTGNPSWFISNAAPLRNLISHESGHGIGLSHSDVTGANAVMETPLQTGFWGVQFDDVYAMNRMYGDPLEKSGGNDTMGAATDLGNLGTSGSVALGTDANDSWVGELDDDWVGIDTNTDADWFKFTTTGAGWAYVRVRPQGPTYTTTEQGADTNFSMRLDLELALYDSTGTLLYSADQEAAGTRELIENVAVGAGDYYVRVKGDSGTPVNQFYRLDVSVSAASQTPSDRRTIFSDAFDVTGASHSDVNHERFGYGRQRPSVADSVYDTSFSGVGAGAAAVIDIHNDRLRLTTTADGGDDEKAKLDLEHNYAPQIAGELWTLSFNLAMSGSAGLHGNSKTMLVFDDDDSHDWYWTGANTLALTFNTSGEVVAKHDGTTLATGSADTSDLGVQLIVDETGSQTLMDIRIGGSFLVEDQAISVADAKRYFALWQFNSSLNPAGVTQAALIDDLTIRLNPFADGDADTDGDVDMDDVTLLAVNYDQSGGFGWSGGDFNLDGAVDVFDLAALASNYDAGSGPSFAEAWAAARVAVPEPGTAAFLLLGALPLTRRRRVI